MSDNPQGRPPGTGAQPGTPAAADPRPSEAEAQPAEEAPQDTAAAGPGDDVRSIHVPDALGDVEEQELLHEGDSTIAAPGAALEELLPALEVTGHEGVDDALATLDDMAEKSVHEHVEVFDAVHEELRRTLDQAAEQ